MSEVVGFISFVGKTGNNVEEQSLSHADQNKSCLSDEQILKLSKIGVFLEKLYGNARDIEWAVHKVFIHSFSFQIIYFLFFFSSLEYGLSPSVTSYHNSQLIH